MRTRRSFLAGTAAAVGGCVSGSDRQRSGSGGTADWTNHHRTRSVGETTRSPVDPDRFPPVGRTIDIVGPGSEWKTDRVTTAAADDGTLTPESPTPFRGERSLYLAGEEGARVSLGFDDPVDFRDSHLSVAMAPHTPPTTDPFRAYLLAPDPENRVTFLGNYHGHFDIHWRRYDMSIDNVVGDPDLSAVNRVVFDIENVPTRCWLDDVRVLPRPDRGKVMFMFDDIPESAFTRGFRIAEDAGLRVAYGVIADAVGEEGRMSVDQLREAEAAGWELVSHSKTGEPLTTVPPETQRRYLAETKEWLLEHALQPAGAEHFVFPQAKYSTTALEAVSDHHEFSYVGGRGSAPALTDPLTVSRRPGERSLEKLRGWLEAAARHSNLLILTFHTISDEFLGTYRSFVGEVSARVKSGDIDVVTPTELPAIQSELFGEVVP